jgi:hypothetical protein
MVERVADGVAATHAVARDELLEQAVEGTGDGTRNGATLRVAFAGRNVIAGIAVKWVVGLRHGQAPFFKERW